MSTKSCRQCNNSFVVTDKDLAFYQTAQVPEPTLCPDCRQQRRLAQINQLFLYSRTCQATGKTIISNHHADNPYPVYDVAYWHGDQWNALDYGRDFDFSRPFFEQFQELSRVVPRPALTTAHEYDENSPYTNYAGRNKNCHMIFDSDSNELCYYSYSLNACKQCIDCHRTRKSELCYECVDCVQCYNSWFLQDCQNCNFSVLLKDCINVSNSIMCVGLRHKEYHIFNKPVSKEEYDQTIQQLSSRTNLEKFRQQFLEFAQQFPNKYIHGSNSENVKGDYLNHCTNALNCYDSSDLENCSYVYQAFDKAKDSVDCDEIGDRAELIYETTNLGYGAYNIKFSMNALVNLANMTYCDYCYHSQNMFGCIGVSKRKFCILNKQYSEEEYNVLVPKIIEHMKKTQEWGEFFPIPLSSFGYNETLAQNYYPLTEEQAKAAGYSWRGDDARQVQPQTVVLPDTSAAATAEITKAMLVCDTCGKNFKIIPQEFTIYQLAKLPLPQTCFHCRHRRRQQQRNPRQLWQRQCMCIQDNHGHEGACTTQFDTTYAPDKTAIVYCEQCYNKEIY